MGRTRRVTALIAVLLVSLLLVASCSGYGRRTADPLPVRRVDRAALVSQINERLALDAHHDAMRALLVYVGGRPVVEQYFDWPSDGYLDVGAVTTTVVDMLIGIAIAEGLIAGVDETLGELLPQRLKDMRPEIAGATLGDLLTMRSGLLPRAPDRDHPFGTGTDPVADALKGPDEPPGKYFELTEQGAHLLSAVLARATGTSVLAYARSRLFDPLGIDSSPAYEGTLIGAADEQRHRSAGFAWPVDRTGLNLGWGALKLRAQDMARLGQLYLDGGSRAGRQVVPASWVGASATRQVADVFPEGEGYGARGYGYGWWTTEADSESAYYAAGCGGQLIEVVPSLSLVVVAAVEVDDINPCAAGLAPATLTFLVDDLIAPAVRGEAQAGE